jgi:hypothetical protein
MAHPSALAGGKVSALENDEAAWREPPLPASA